MWATTAGGILLDRPGGNPGCAAGDEQVGATTGEVGTP